MARLIDIDELADYLKLKKQTIYNWLHQRKISGIKVGGVWRFHKDQFVTWLEHKGKTAQVEPVDTGKPAKGVRKQSNGR